MLTAIIPSSYIINRFAEDTCVLVALAYLVSRGALLPSLFSGHRQRNLVTLAVVFGLIGASEIVFPGDRYPYVPYTLAAAFAGFAGGANLGLLTAGTVGLAVGVSAIFGLRVPSPLVLILAVFAAGLIGAATSRWSRSLSLSAVPRLASVLLGAFSAGALAELVHALLRAVFHEWDTVGPGLSAMTPVSVVYSVASNGLGCVLLGLVLDDANQRRLAQLRQLEAEREIAALRLSQMGELQARLHPHFLFNALAGIAGLCLTNPREAERCVANLAILLRRLLRTPVEASIPLGEELTMVRSYLVVEKMRMEDRLTIIENLPDDLLGLPVPRFCIQVPVENAVQHGIAPSGQPGCLRIAARRYGNHLLLAISDNGIGAPASLKASLRVQKEKSGSGPNEAPHGLGLLAIRLHLAYGMAARLRLCSVAGRGTLYLLRLPV